jgi:hypothetical protein
MANYTIDKTNQITIDPDNLTYLDGKFLLTQKTSENELKILRLDPRNLPATYSTAVKTLNTTATGAQITSSSESLAGSGTVTLHKISKTGSYNDLLGKPTKLSDFTNDSGFTSNKGTITGITMNGVSKGTSGVINLGTVLTAHQALKTINHQSIIGTGDINITAAASSPIRDFQEFTRETLTNASYKTPWTVWVYEAYNEIEDVTVNAGDILIIQVYSTAYTNTSRTKGLNVATFIKKFNGYASDGDELYAQETGSGIATATSMSIDGGIIMQYRITAESTGYPALRLDFTGRNANSTPVKCSILVIKGS